MLKYEVWLTKKSLRHYRHNKLHRKDRPTTVWPEGYQSWWEYGLRHRKDGPATIWKDESREYWCRGIRKC